MHSSGPPTRDLPILTPTTNPTYIAAKKAKHLEDSETTPKSYLDAVF